MTKRDKQIGNREEHRPKARMDQCALMEVLYYALCGIPGGSRVELSQFPRMVRVMEGHEVFGPLQLRRIDWNQEMFEEEEGQEQVEAVPGTGKASSSRQPMEVDDESKKAVSEPVAVVDATKVAEEKGEEADVEVEETMGVKRSRRWQEKEEGDVSLWADVGGGGNSVSCAKWEKWRWSRAVVVIRCSGVV